MDIDNFPGCCNAYVIHQFGGTDAACTPNRAKRNRDELREELEEYVDNQGERKLLVACTNTDQTDANVLLKEYDFIRTRTIPKHHHADTGLILWWRQPTSQPSAVLKRRL